MLLLSCSKPLRFASGLSVLFGGQAYRFVPVSLNNWSFLYNTVCLCPPYTHSHLFGLVLFCLANWTCFFSWCSQFENTLFQSSTLLCVGRLPGQLTDGWRACGSVLTRRVPVFPPQQVVQSIVHLHELLSTLQVCAFLSPPLTSFFPQRW